jgi:hypothetical protein
MLPRTPTPLPEGNPAFAGKLFVKLLILREEFRLSFANGSPQIFAMAHLYNALCEYGYLDKEKHVWPLLEEVVEMQMKPIFLGERPTTGRAMLSRCLVAYGYSPKFASSFCNLSPSEFRWAQVKRLRLNQRNEHKSDLLMHPTMVPLSEYFHNNGMDFSRVLHLMDLEMVKVAKLPKSSRGAKPVTSFADLGAIPFLEEIEKHVQCFKTRFDLDLVEFTCKCSALFYQIYSAMTKKQIKVLQYDSRDWVGADN